MNILYCTTDRIQLKFSIKETSIPFVFTDFFRIYHRDFNFINCFIRKMLCGKQVKKNGKYWYRISDVLFFYRPNDLSFIFEINPLKITSLNLHKCGSYKIQKSLDHNTNFIDPQYLNGISAEQIEGIIAVSLEQAKNNSLETLKRFLTKGFGVDFNKIDIECKLHLFELACDIRHENPSEFIRQIEKPLIANFGDTTKFGTAKSHSLTVFKRKRDAGTQEMGKETRIIYQKAVNIVRFERVFSKTEIKSDDVKRFKSEEFQSFFEPFKQIVKNELQELFTQVDTTGKESSEEFKLSLTMWLWKKLSAIKIPLEKFYLIEMAIETEQLDTSLLCDPYLKSKLLETGAFVPVMESAGMKRHRYLRINKKLFRTETQQ